MKILDRWGILLALIFGILILFSGGPHYLFLMFSFLFLGVLATRYDHEIKREMGIYEHERGWENVLSNGLVPTLFALLSFSFGPFPYISAVAATTADTFASEIGVLGKEKPISIANFKKVKPGTSGAISSVGTVASLMGAVLIGLISMFLFEDVSPFTVLMIGFIGFFGSLIDTFFGVFEEMGFGTKGTTNFICALSGAFLGCMVFGC